MSQIVLEKNLVCPVCKSTLMVQSSELLGCTEATCGRTWPIENGIPDLLAEDLLVEDDFETDFHQRVKKKSLIGKLYVDYAFALRERLIEAQVQSLGRPLDILDVGSGALLHGQGGQGGAHFRLLKRYSRSYKAIEPSWAMINQVNVPDGNLYHLPEATMVRGVGEQLPFPGESCDAVFFLSMLDHVADPVAVLREARSVLRPGGMVLISLQNYQSWQRQLARFLLPAYMRHREEEHDHHNWRFTPEMALKLLADTGYKSTTCVELNYLMFPRLHWLETLLFGLPAQLIRPEARLTWLERLNHRLAQRFAGKGGAFFCYGYGE